MRSRATLTPPPLPQYASLETWVASESKGLTDGQSVFVRYSLLRRIEIAEQTVTLFADLPAYARSQLEAAGLGEECWRDGADWGK